MRGKFDRTDSEGVEEIYAEELKGGFQKFLLVVKAFKRYPYTDSFCTNKTIGSMRRER